MTRTKYYQAFAHALTEEMKRDPRVVLMGEDVGQSGGIFAHTKGIYEVIGPERVRDTPIAENGFVSAAVGAAMTGLRPVVEIGFEDFFTACMDPLVNQAAKLRYMLGGQVTIPMVIYTFGGGGLNAGPQHSQSFAPWFAQVPGLKAVMPATPADVLGLTRAAIRDDNPVLLLMSKKLISLSGNVGEADLDAVLPLDRANVVAEGGDCTVVTYGTILHPALKARAKLQEAGVEIEVIDGRCVNPIDFETIAASVARTGRLLVVHEAHLPCGMGAEILARAVETMPETLLCRPRRMGPPFAPSPFAPNLEKAYLPSAEGIAETVSAMIQEPVLRWRAA
ncbi:MAG: transketolase C-terminal domain-containing protein [Roseovarius sp.]